MKRSFYSQMQHLVEVDAILEPDAQHQSSNQYGVVSYVNLCCIYGRMIFPQIPILENIYSDFLYLLPYPKPS